MEDMPQMHQMVLRRLNNSPTARQLQTDAINRPFTLQEALPYTPQSSTAPFCSSVIPSPRPGAGSAAPSVADLFPRDEYDNLNREAESQGQASVNMKQAVEFVLQDLKPGQRTKYNFRNHAPQRRTTRSTSRQEEPKNMSILTKAVHDQHVTSFWKTTKSSAQSGKAVNGTSSPATNKATTPSKPTSATKPKKPKQTNKEVQYDNITTVNDDSAVAAQDGVNGTNGFQISIPSTNINHGEYMEVAGTVDAPTHLSARKAQEDDEGHDVVNSGLDQRQRGKAAADSLNSLIRNTFSAVGKAMGMEEGQDHIATMLSNTEATLTAATQHKLHGAIQKAIDFKTFDQVSAENLLQIMKLSEASLKYMDGIELHVEESWDETAVETWIQQLGVIDRALKSSRTCLRIMSGGRPEKQLYSESIISSSIELVESMTQNIVTPLVELRPSGSGADLFKLLGKHKKIVSATFLSCQKLAASLAEVITKIDLSEQAFSKLENTASKLIFVENAHVERESLVGVQKFDGIRSVAMDILCQIFLIKPDQRQSIIDDILSSLEKLPVGKLSSRQFKLSDGGSVQPVSALLMRLVQASSAYVDRAQQGRRATLLQSIEELGDAEGEPELPDSSKPSQQFSSITGEDHAAQEHAIATQELDACASPLTDTATRNASYIINYIVTRALRSTKSGDTPYRNLLDLFVEDFTTCLDSPDWPSAELLLRLLMLVMVQQVETAKTAAPAKNMALELLGTMSAAISRLRSHVKRTATTLDSSEADDMSRYLASLAVNVLEQTSPPEQLVDWSGPYRAVLESIQARCAEDPHLSSAISFIVADWASRACAVYRGFVDQDAAREASMGTLAYRLSKMIQDRQWLSNQFSFKVVSSPQAKMAYSIVLLRSPLCESFPKVLNILLSSMASDQATVRSKSLKSVNQVLETDPSILDGESTVIQLILDCATDSSIQVRDSALGLLGSCISMRPVLEPDMTPKILDRFLDAGVGVRKRAMKLARDIYLRNRNKTIRTAIANGLLRRIQDPDEGIRDLARQMMEEVWFVPFYRDDGSASFQTAISEHVTLVIQTIKTGPVTEILDKVFQTILRPNNKSLDGPFSVCSRLVSDMFGLLDNPESEDGSAPAGKDALQVLTIFANADPKLFNFEQIRLLKPQLASFTGNDELAAFRAVTIIYKRVLPELPNINRNFLAEVRLQMMKNVSKISSRGALDDLIACIKTICDLLKDHTPLANMTATGLAFVMGCRGSLKDAVTLTKFKLYALIIGTVAKHCDLDQNIQIFRAKMPNWKGTSVPRLIVDLLAPYTSPDLGLEARKASLEAIGLTCQSWPRNYDLAKVYTAFQQVFNEQNAVLEERILKSLKEFLMGEERRSEQATAAASAPDQKRELTVMGGTSFDDVASATTQRFLPGITRIALSSQGEHALLAMEVLGSINRQGLTHPKETGVTLITLETSSNRRIAELAYQEHRTLHEKHETVIEREYAKAIQAAFNYQRDVEDDPHGATTEPFQSKLHFMVEVLKISKLKSRQRFFEKICMQADFDPSNLNVNQNPPEHLSYTRFLAENLAYFEYQTVGELQGTIAKIEKIASTTGATLAQEIESEVLDAHMDAEGEDVDAPGELTVNEVGLPVAPSPPPIGAGVHPQLLRRLATGSIVLSMLWETSAFLRRLYGLGVGRFDSKSKTLAKDANKAPTKSQNTNGEKIWEELDKLSKGLDSQSQLGATCKAFVTLLHEDKELKVADDDDLDGEDPSTPSDGEENDEFADRGRKRKGGSTPGGRKKRQRSSSQSNKRGRPRKSDGESDDELLDEDWA